MSEEFWIAVISAIVGSGIGAGVLELAKRWMDKKSDQQQSLDDYQRGMDAASAHYTPILADRDAQRKRDQEYYQQIIADKDDQRQKETEYYQQQMLEREAQHKKEVKRLEKTIDQDSERLAHIEQELEDSKAQFAAYLEKLMRTSDKAEP